LGFKDHFEPVPPAYACDVGHALPMKSARQILRTTMAPFKWNSKPSEDTMSYKIIDSRFANANVQDNKPFAVVAIDRLGFHKIITSFRTHQAAVRACIYLSRKAA
jgi:hypothetical protein